MLAQKHDYATKGNRKKNEPYLCGKKFHPSTAFTVKEKVDLN